ncbi:hypothetical protein [Chitinophaga niabensis]|uniref:Uncharacterized protein n=1 Tax=Chitinophaga niabensis TaxID=536979 RepID=A0A1N6JY26_9BACT|nr:hypothetical protein [Chitinophaga niabensis]SIO49255.1 hypothetical protein SAMN04488055_4682 [Chitinophaga niabensis]
MAKQEGPIKITGTLGDKVYYKRGNSFYVKQKKHVDPKHIIKGPGYNTQRANMMEFGHASKAAQLIFLAFAHSHRLAKDICLSGHLTREIRRVIKSDKQNEYGKRNITDAETFLMEGFEFNEDAPLSKVLLVPYTATINTDTGKMQVTITGQGQHKMVKAPRSATHFMVHLAASSIDFVNRQHVSCATSSETLPLEGTPGAPLTLIVNLPPNNVHPHFLALRISFLQECNGVIKPLNTIVHNAMAFVKVHSV